MRRISRSIWTFLFLWTLASHAQAPAPALQPERTLPLRRFEVSRQVQTDAQGYFQPAFAIGDDYFDGRDTRARVRRHLRVAKQIGVKYLRCAFSWNGIEPEDGRYNFKFWDMLVEEASRAEVRLIPYVAYTPEWAARSKKQFWQQPPRDPALFARLMRKLAERYRGKILSWELWNEPDLQEYWQGTAAEFAELVKAGAKAVRDADPNAVIVLAGMSHGPGPFFNELITQHRIDLWVDVIAMHGYPESWDEDRAEAVYDSRIQKMSNSIAKDRPEPDMWLNEMGYADYRYKQNKASTWGTDTYYAYEHTRRYQAEFLFKSFAMTVASGKLSLAGWYRIDDFPHSDRRMPEDKVHYHLGIVDVNGRPKPSFYAMKFASRLFQNPVKAQQVWVESDAQTRSQAVVDVFRTRDEKVIVTGWLRSSEYSEVARHSGMEADRRRERVNIALPCITSRVSTYNALGTRLTSMRVSTRMLRKVVLTGSRVYVAEATCAAVQ